MADSHAAIADGSWRIDCQQVGLTEPSRLTFSGGVDDPNYQASAEAKFPIDVGLKKYVVTIIPSAGWNALAPGEVYWLNAAGADFNAPFGEPCCMRADITVSALSYMALHHTPEEFPLRLCYAERVFSVPRPPKENLEDTQVGAELLGWKEIIEDRKSVV